MHRTSILQALQEARRDISDTDARILLQTLLGISHAYLIAHSDFELTMPQTRRFRQLISGRARGMPVSYLTGSQEFYGIDFKVTPEVLIPRPETELLVDLSLEKIPADQARRILDLGTGSGAIAITVAKHRPCSHVTAVDCSPGAIAVAELNALALCVPNVRIVESHWFKELAGEKFDLIVTNPPYVAGGDSHLVQGDLRFEPKMALTTGGCGMESIRFIIHSAGPYLFTGGVLLLEHGYGQGESCRKLLSGAGFKRVFSCPDLAGIIRVSGGYWEFDAGKC